MSSADIKSKLKRLAGMSSDTAPAASAPTIKTPAAKANPQWLDELSQDDEEAVAPEEESIDNDDVEESDIPDESHRQPVVNFKPSPVKPEDMQGLPGTDEFARKVADLVVARIRDALNHLVID